MKKTNYLSVKKPNLSALDLDVKKYLGDPKRIFSMQKEIYLSGNKTKKSKKSVLTRDINSLKKHFLYLRNKKDMANSQMQNSYHLGEVINEKKLNQVKTEIRVLETIRKEIN